MIVVEEGEGIRRKSAYFPAFAREVLVKRTDGDDCVSHYRFGVAELQDETTPEVRIIEA